MSDINTGRMGTPLGDALRELAALRAENGDLRGLLAETVPDPEYRRMQDIEIERLREERKRLREALTSANETIVKLSQNYNAEFDRLREALEETHQFLIDLPVRGPNLERTLVLGIQIRAALAKEFANDGVTDDSETLRLRAALAKEAGQ